MANPQKENGYVAISNELFERIYTLKLNGTQFKILLFIMRYTYGFNRSEHEFSLRFIATGINCSERAVSKELTRLIELNLIKVIANPNGNHARVLKLNKDYENWKIESGNLSHRVEQLFMNNCSGRTIVRDEQLFNERVEQQFYERDEQLFHQDNTNINTNINTESVYIDIYNYIRDDYTPALKNVLINWIKYRRLSPDNIKALTELVDKYLESYSDADISGVITECIAEGRKVIYWDRLERRKSDSEFDILKNNVEPDELERFTWEKLQ